MGYLAQHQLFDQVLFDNTPFKKHYKGEHYQVFPVLSPHSLASKWSPGIKKKNKTHKVSIRR